MNLGDLRQSYQVDKEKSKKGIQDKKMGKLVNFLGGDMNNFEGEDLGILQEYIL